MRRIVVFCEDCRKVVTIVPTLQASDLTRLRLHFGRHNYDTTEHTRRHIRLTVKGEAA